MTVPEAAKIMGVSPQFLRLGIQEGSFPFGVAVKFSKKWSYYINPAAFEKYIRGESNHEPTTKNREEEAI